MASRLNIDELVKNVPLCDFEASSKWTEEIKKALDGANLGYCLTYRLTELYGEIVAAKFTIDYYRVKQFHEGYGLDFWLPTADPQNPHAPRTLLCRAHCDMTIKEKAEWDQQYITASTIIWATLSAGMKLILASYMETENRKKRTRDLWDAIQDLLQNQVRWQRIRLNKKLNRLEMETDEQRIKEQIQIEDDAWKGKFQNGKLSGNKRKIGESSVDQSANYTQNRRARTGKSNSSRSSRRDRDEFFCTFCSRDNHKREQCFLDPKGPSFDQGKVDDLLARNKRHPSNSKHMKKMLPILQSAQYKALVEEANQVRSNIADVDSDDEDEDFMKGELFSICGLK
eukprot:TRINITY_DN2381_c1_g1_i6.p1 TRINITY_DN2381_c1_g1~~TRINITY_DN2381_c1_g1_i6.p1  ORF type:complete len:351 (-),score=81.69 TRINITY_DN2381_c1_g1_i6:1897-2919(-)